MLAAGRVAVATLLSAGVSRSLLIVLKEECYAA